MLNWVEKYNQTWVGKVSVELISQPRRGPVRNVKGWLGCRFPPRALLRDGAWASSVEPVWGAHQPVCLHFASSCCPQQSSLWAQSFVLLPFTRPVCTVVAPSLSSTTTDIMWQAFMFLCTGSNYVRPFYDQPSAPLSASLKSFCSQWMQTLAELSC